MAKLKDCQPYFIYQRITLLLDREYFTFKLDQGYRYLLRDMVVAYPEIDNTGLLFGPYLRFKWVQKAQDVNPMKVPIPFRLVSSPASAGIAVTVGDQLTTTNQTQPKNQKTLNVLYPEKDLIYIEITGQNGTTPELVDIMLNGYLIY